MMSEQSRSGLESKSAPGAEIASAFEEFMTTFEAFKEANDRRLADIERRGSADGETEAKVARISRALDEMELKAQRPAFGIAASGARPSEHKAAFDAYVRKGEETRIRGIEKKALSVGSNPDGGYLVPEEIERTVNSALKAISPIRAIAGIQQVSSSVYKRPFATTSAATGWVGETAARPETATPTLAELSFPTMELYAMPAATGSILDDSAVDIERWIAEEVRLAFAQQEGQAFVSGDGINKPKGFLSYTKVANGSWSWGNIGYLTTGAAGAFGASSPSDKLLDLIYSVKAGYRANGTFVMSRSTQAEVRKLKDAEGNYLWLPAQKPGESPTLMNYPVAEAEDMPAIAADAFAIAFGDFSRGYLVVDRVGIRVLRDPYSAKPYVLFYTTKRVGGGVQDFNAIKLLKFGTA